VGGGCGVHATSESNVLLGYIFLTAAKQLQKVEQLTNMPGRYTLKQSILFKFQRALNVRLLAVPCRDELTKVECVSVWSVQGRDVLKPQHAADLRLTPKHELKFHTFQCRPFEMWVSVRRNDRPAVLFMQLSAADVIEIQQVSSLRSE
jgi:hypothetical protein